MDSRAAKYAGERCCVCGKYGAHEPFGEPLSNLKAYALANRYTLKMPERNAIHDKCLVKLKTLINWRRASDNARIPA